MFWIGFCVGVSACFLVCLIGLSTMYWSVGKERTAALKRPDIPPELVDYWKTANQNIEAQYVRLGEILNKLADK